MPKLETIYRYNLRIRIVEIALLYFVILFREFLSTGRIKHNGGLVVFMQRPLHIFLQLQAEL